MRLSFNSKTGKLIDLDLIGPTMDTKNATIATFDRTREGWEQVAMAIIDAVNVPPVPARVRP